MQALARIGAMHATINGPYRAVKLTKPVWQASEMLIVVECGDDRVYRDRVERRTRDLEGFPEPTWGGVLRRRANFPPWVDERLTIDSVNSREANLQAALEYLSADRL
jgi:hypothetical protein